MNIQNNMQECADIKSGGDDKLVIYPKYLSRLSSVCSMRGIIWNLGTKEILLKRHQNEDTDC